MNQITVHGKTYKLPKNPVWRSGPPPSIGWWPASAGKWLTILRWWDGIKWSEFVSVFEPEKNVKNAAEKPSRIEFGITWTDQWWK